jgi:hypothetical protein
MKTHPALAAIAKTTNDGARAVEGYLEVGGDNVIRVHSSLEGGPVWELESADVLHEEEVPGSNGKARLYVGRDARVRMTVSLRLNEEGTGTQCGSSGTMYCWRRIPVGNGSYVVIYEPCGSCIPEGGGSIAALL